MDRTMKKQIIPIKTALAALLLLKVHLTLLLLVFCCSGRWGLRQSEVVAKPFLLGVGLGAKSRFLSQASS